MYRLLWLILLVLTRVPAAAQDLELVPNRTLQVKYAVPPNCAVTRQRTDSVDVLGYHNPADNARLWVGQLRGRHATLPPARALQRLLRHLGITDYEEHHALAHGLSLLESTGTCLVDGRALRYEARVTTYQGQLLQVYLYATPAMFSTQAPLLHRVLDSFAPLRGK